MSTGDLIRAHAENIQILAKKEERIRFITSLVKNQLAHFGTTPGSKDGTSKLGLERPSNDSLWDDSIDSQAAQDFRNALARHHPNLRVDPSTRQRLRIGEARRPESEEPLPELLSDRVSAAAVEIRLLLMLSFIFCMLALISIYRAAFPKKRL